MPAPCDPSVCKTPRCTNPIAVKKHALCNACYQYYKRGLCRVVLPPIPEGLKYCSSKHHEYGDNPVPIESFYSHMGKSGRLEYRKTCKDCVKKEARFRWRNNSKERERRLQYRVDNKERLREYSKQWNKKNRDKLIARNANRRATVAGLPSHWSNEMAQEAVLYWGGRCAYCDEPQESLAFDHWVPVAGEQPCPGTVPTNMVPSCRACNSGKHTKHPHEYLAADVIRLIEVECFLAHMGTKYEN